MNKEELLFSVKAYDDEDGEIFSGKRIKVSDLTSILIELWKNWGARSFRMGGKITKVVDKK
jgi:hypothetical protein